MTTPQHLILLFTQTLSPATTQQATYQLHQLRTSPNFTTSLLLIADDQHAQFSIRLSALVYLKNLVKEEIDIEQISVIPSEDVIRLKESIVTLLIRFIQKNEVKLLPTVSNICCLMAQGYFVKSEWETLLPQLVANLEKCDSFEAIKGTLIMTKILFQLLGRSLMQQPKLNALSNQIIPPLLKLSHKMLADLSPVSFALLQEVFRIFNDAIEYHLPEVLQKNIDALVGLVKGALNLISQSQVIRIQTQLTTKLQCQQSQLKLLKLKKSCLIFLEKLYQRHTTPNLTSQQKFISQFNSKYTLQFFQTVTQIISSQQPHASNIAFQLLTHAIRLLSFMLSSDTSSLHLRHTLAFCQGKILFQAMTRFTACHSRKFQSKVKNASMKNTDVFDNFNDFVETYHEEREGLRLLVSTLFENKNVEDRVKNVSGIVDELCGWVRNGDLKEKELGLYLLVSLAKGIEALYGQCYVQLNERLSEFIITVIHPLLSLSPSDTSPQTEFHTSLIQSRAYQTYTSFQFLTLPQPHIICTLQLIFLNLTLPSQTQLSLFTKITSLATFNSFLATDNQLIDKISSHIPKILQLYTQLLSKDFEVMTYYEEVLNLFADYIQPLVVDLLDLLTDVFLGLVQTKTAKLNCLSGAKNDRELKWVEDDQQEDDEILKFNREGEQSDNETEYENLEQTYDNIGGQCLGSIRKLIFKNTLPVDHQMESYGYLKEKLFMLVLNGLGSRDEVFVKESLGILNLLLYKQFVSQKFIMMVSILLLPILCTISQPHQTTQFLTNLSTQLQHSPSSLLSLYLKTLQTLCHDPLSLSFTLTDSSCCLKNLIKLYNSCLSTVVCPVTRQSYLSLVMEVIRGGVEVDGEEKMTKAEVITVVGMVETLIENRVGWEGDGEGFGKVVAEVVRWNLNAVGKESEKGGLIMNRYRMAGFRALMMALGQYPQHTWAVIQQITINNSLQQIVLNNPTTQLPTALTDLLLTLPSTFIIPLSQLTSPLHHTNDTIIIFLGISSFLQLTYDKFFAPEKPLSQKEIPGHFRKFLDRLLKLVFKFGVQVTFLAAKDYYGERFESELEMIRPQIQRQYEEFERLEREQSEGQLGMGSQSQATGKRQVRMDEGQMLMMMLNNLSLQSQKQQQQHHPHHLNSLNPHTPHTHTLHSHYQQHLKQTHQLLDFNQDMFSQQSSSSHPNNPFQPSTQQDCLHLYQPPSQGPTPKTRNQHLLSSVQRLTKVFADQKIFYVKERVFARY